MFHDLSRLINAIKKAKRLIESNTKEMYSQYKSEIESNNTLSKKDKKNLLSEIRKILSGLIEEENKRIKKLTKWKRDLLLRLGNVFLFFAMVMLSVIYGVLLYLNDRVLNAIIYPIIILSLLGFIVIQILYTVKFLKAIKSTIHGVIIFCIKRMFSTLLVVWSYLFIVAVVNLWETKMLTYSFSAVFMLYIIFMIYDLFLSSNLFDEAESALSLIVAIIVGLFYFAESVDNLIIKQIGAVILFSACLLLHVLIVKKFILDKKPIKDILGIMSVVLIVVTAIVLTVVALYKILWIIPTEGQVADNTLFSAVIGIYAAILGGGLTLAGVAWTIKHNQEIRQEDKKNEIKPFFGLLNNLNVEVVAANEHVYHFSTREKCGEIKSIMGNFVNSDKNCFILKKIVIGEVAYTPDSQYLISKQEVFQIRIFEGDIPSDECIITLVVEDQNGNEWLYNLVKNGLCIISMKEQQGENK